MDPLDMQFASPAKAEFAAFVGQQTSVKKGFSNANFVGQPTSPPGGFWSSIFAGGTSTKPQSCPPGYVLAWIDYPPPRRWACVPDWNWN